MKIVVFCWATAAVVILPFLTGCGTTGTIGFRRLPLTVTASRPDGTPVTNAFFYAIPSELWLSNGFDHRIQTNRAAAIDTLKIKFSNCTTGNTPTTISLRPTEHVIAAQAERGFGTVLVVPGDKPSVDVRIE